MRERRRAARGHRDRARRDRVPGGPGPRDRRAGREARRRRDPRASARATASAVERDPHGRRPAPALRLLRHDRRGQRRVVGRLRRVHGDLPRHRAAPDVRPRSRPSSSRCSSRSPARCTGSRPSACARARPSSSRVPGTRAWRCSKRCSRASRARSIVTGTSDDGLRLDAAKEIGASEVVMVDTTDAVALVRDLTAAPAPTSCSTSPPRRRPSRWRSTSRAAAGGSCSRGSSTSPRSPGWCRTTSCSRASSSTAAPASRPQSMAAAVAAHRVGRGAHRRRRRRGVRPRRHRRGHGAAPARPRPGRDAVRVGLRHSHGSVA